MFVTSWMVSAVDEHPIVSITFAYDQIKHEYYTQDDKGTVALANSYSYSTSTNSGA